MRIRVLGCGNAFSNLNFNQMYLLEEEHEGKTRKMLLDCGYQAQAALKNAGIPVTEIDDIYVSHLHADHIGGLEFVAFSRYDWSKFPRPHLATMFSGREAPHIYCEENLMHNLWDRSLRGGLESMEGFIATLNTYFVTHPIDISEGFTWQGWKVELVQQIHLMSGSQIALAFGLFFTKKGHKSVYFTTDSQHCSPNQVEVFYNRADMIFQDCELTPFLSHVHANYIQIAGHDDANTRRLSSSIKAKMKLSHYQDLYTNRQKMVMRNCEYSFYRAPASQQEPIALIDFDWDEAAKKDGFDGFVRVGDVFETFEG